MASGSTTALLVIITMTMAMALAAFIFLTRRKAVIPGQALVVYGRKLPGGGPAYQVLVGSEGRRWWRFVIPIIEDHQVLPLISRELTYEFRKALVGASGDPARANIAIGATVKVTDKGSGLNIAVQYLLGKTEEEITELMKKATEAHIRQGLAWLHADMVLNDRAGTADALVKMANGPLMNAGLTIVDMEITEVVA
jgi:uncharacterized membrane protein YqiK